MLNIMSLWRQQPDFKLLVNSQPRPLEQNITSLSSILHTCTHTHMRAHKHTQTQPFYGSLDTVQVNPGEPVAEETFTHSHLSWSSVNPYVLPLCALQSFSTIPLQVCFGLPLGVAPSTSYSIHSFTQSLSSFRNTCSYHRNLFHCSTEIVSNPSLSLNPLLGILLCSFTPHIHLTILISAR